MTQHRSDGNSISEADALDHFSRSNLAMVISDPSRDDNPLVYVNRAFETLTGYTSTMVVGRNCRFLQGEDTEPEEVAKVARAIEAAEEVSVELWNYKADGTRFRNRLHITPVRDRDGTSNACFIGLQAEITGQGDARDTSIDNQLQEIQHRVKNHLSMIIGMIRMQSRDASDPEDFGELARRVETLQLLYEEMSNAGSSSNEDTIPLGAYLSRVANTISHLDGRPGVRILVEIEPIDAPLHTATQIGLILSETLTNAFQHAFKEQESGTVEVRSLTLGKTGMRLTISDDGAGLPEGTEWPTPGSLGGRIVQGLVESVDGSLDVSGGANGTIVTIDIPDVDPMKTK
ncbi:PAS domain-containing protein [Roseicyclus sp. F158]|uniref:PAS domain-containing protein n=1 Tax=Tropicimonas omnivorans TaxID=3075590 RepID=A0ABU3DF79_9RHOB|nr:PAS domain-containing protein [Roseicyclus sp. F158]MDT0682373.1 PAS domain-containing protein [Roseicyclus sp. F158]